MNPKKLRRQLRVQLRQKLAPEQVGPLFRRHYRGRSDVLARIYSYHLGEEVQKDLLEKRLLNLFAAALAARPMSPGQAARLSHEVAGRELVALCEQKMKLEGNDGSRCVRCGKDKLNPQHLCQGCLDAMGRELDGMTGRRAA